MSASLENQAYIPALWEHPTLCIAFFGVQFHTEEGQKSYHDSGIEAEVLPALSEAEGLLLNREMMTKEGPVIMQYWKSHEDLNNWSRKLPHTRWWQWLVDNVGNGVCFYHEIYQIKTAEAIYEPGTTPVGPALFCSLQPVKTGEGKSKQRQQKFSEAATKVE